LENLSVSKFWNIGISGQSNNVNWPNIAEKNLKISVTVSTKGYRLVSNLYLLEKWRHFVSSKTLLCFRVRIRVRVSVTVKGGCGYRIRFRSNTFEQE